MLCLLALWPIFQLLFFFFFLLSRQTTKYTMRGSRPLDFDILNAPRQYVFCFVFSHLRDKFAISLQSPSYVISRDPLLVASSPTPIPAPLDVYHHPTGSSIMRDICLFNTIYTSLTLHGLYKYWELRPDEERSTVCKFGYPLRQQLIG